MVEANSTIYLTSWLNDKIVDIEGNTFFNVCEKPHGLATNDGSSFWIANLNDGKVMKYGENSQVIEVGGQPVNMLITDDRFYIADREQDRILSYGYNSSTVSNVGRIEYDLSSFLDAEIAVGYIDMFKDGDTLYVASDEYNGFITIDLSEGNILGQTYSPTTSDYGATEIVVSGSDIYLNTGNRIIKWDGSEWETIVSDLSGDSGYNYSGKYVDLILSTTCYGGDDDSASKYLYVAAGINPDKSEEGTLQHVIRYSFDGTDWEYSKTIDFL